MASGAAAAQHNGGEPTAHQVAAQPWAVGALALAAAGVAGSLYLSLGLGLRACPLCFYQRTFAMSVLAVLAVGLFVNRTKAGLMSLLSLPSAAGGLGVACFHVYLVLADRLECPAGLFGLGTAPVQSLALFVLLTAALGTSAWRGRNHQAPPGPAVGVLAGAAALGLLLAWACVVSAPPLPKATPPDPDKPFDTCRPPWRG